MLVYFMCFTLQGSQKSKRKVKCGSDSLSARISRTLKRSRCFPTGRLNWRHLKIIFQNPKVPEILEWGTQLLFKEQYAKDLATTSEIHNNMWSHNDYRQDDHYLHATGRQKRPNYFLLRSLQGMRGKKCEDEEGGGRGRFSISWSAFPCFLARSCFLSPWFNWREGEASRSQWWSWRESSSILSI